MSNCCADPASKGQAGLLCPVSGTKGNRVELQTVKALVTERALGRLNPTPHCFCPDPECPVIYFDTAGNRYARADVRVAVWHKEPFGNRMVCYCFGENEADIRDELTRLRRSEAVERVRRHIEAGRCACELRNPRGVCCLGDVTAAVKRVAVSLDSAQPEAR